MPATARPSFRPVGPGLQTRDEQQVDDFDGAIVETDANRPTWRGERKDLGVLDRQRTAICQEYVKWLERSGLVHLAKLFDGHMRHAPNSVCHTRSTRAVSDHRQAASVS